MFKRKIGYIGLSLVLAASCIYAEQVEHSETNSVAKNKDWNIKAGFMAFANTRLVYSDRNGADFTGTLFVVVEYKDFYWEGTEVGYVYEALPQLKLTPFVQFTGGLGLAGAPSVFGGKGIDMDELAPGYRGIGDRATQFEGGLKAELSLSEKYMVELEGRVGEWGSTGKLLLQRNFMGRQGKWILSPFIAGRILSPDFMDHFFSVSSQQAADPRSFRINSAYDANKIGTAGSVGFSGFYQIDEKWALIISLEEQVVSDEIKDSPFVKNRDVLAGLIGAAYTF